MAGHLRRATLALVVALGAARTAPAAVTVGIPDADDPVHMSRDGRYLYFNFYPRLPYGGGAQLHLDRQTGVRTLVATVPANGDQGTAISGNGRVVAFGYGTAFYSPILPDDNGELWDVYVGDLDAGTLSRTSVASDGTQGNGHSAFPALSGDGRYVAFASAASNLVADDTNGKLDVFVHDRLLHVTERVNVRSDGTQSAGDISTIANGPPLYFNHSPSISADGRYVAFWSLASDLVPGDTNQNFDAFVHDRATGETTRVSVKSDGSESFPFLGPVHLGMSGDGRFVAFESRTNDLDPRKTTPYDVQGVFLHDRQTGVTELASLNSAGESANGLSSGDPYLSFDGRFLTFVSSATNLVPDDTNGVADIFLRDRLLGTTERVNVTSSGGEGRGYLGPGAGPFRTSDDGRFAAFSSPVELDPEHGHAWIYVRDRTCANGVVEGSERCDDGNAVDDDGCNRDCRPTDCSGSVCGDGIVGPCETCDPGTGTATCCSADCTDVPAGTPCDDGDACTQDACAAGRACVPVAPVCDACLACVPGSGACVPPTSACAPAGVGRASLRLALPDNPAGSTASWTWIGADAVAAADFGLPPTTSDYRLCVYGEDGLTLRAEAPAGGLCAGRACWKPTSTGFRYRDRERTPDGLLQVLLKAGVAGRAKIKVRGRGTNLRLGPLGFDTPVTVRLSRTDGPACWQARFSAPTRNDATAYKAKSD